MTFPLENVAIWGRSFDEYLRMFQLDGEGMGKRIVGCGDGPASFNAEMRLRGKHVVSVDPLYVFSPEQIRCRIHEVFETMIDAARQKADTFVWNEIQSPEHLGTVRMAAMNRFLDDYAVGRTEGRYVIGSLPNLPFGNDVFDMALCSHYLFTYSQSISEDEHVDRILEMSRVANEVRIFPLLDMFDGGRSPHLEHVVRRLRRTGVHVRTRTVPYEFQRGGNEMLEVIRGS